MRFLIENIKVFIFLTGYYSNISLFWIKNCSYNEFVISNYLFLYLSMDHPHKNPNTLPSAAHFNTVTSSLCATRSGSFEF